MLIRQRPSRLLWMIEGRGFFEYFGYLMSRDQLGNVPRGDGHPVLVIPGWLTSDRSTGPMRKFLNELDYRAYGWQLGRNMGASEEVEASLRDQLSDLTQSFGQKVSLIGWSAGGIYARVLARENPELVRQVITMGSPFRGIKGASNVDWLYEWITGDSLDEVDSEIQARAADKPPVPTTAIYSKGDGIVHWQACREPMEGEGCQNIEVKGSHTGLGHNVAVLRCVADRLAMPEDNWYPYRENSY